MAKKVANKVSKKADMQNMCNMGKCMKCWALVLIVIGVLIILNDIYGRFTWATFWGGILVIKGALGLIKPTCGHC